MKRIMIVIGIIFLLTVLMPFAAAEDHLSENLQKIIEYHGRVASGFLTKVLFLTVFVGILVLFSRQERVKHESIRGDNI